MVFLEAILLIVTIGGLSCGAGYLVYNPPECCNSCNGFLSNDGEIDLLPFTHLAWRDDSALYKSSPVDYKKMFNVLFGLETEDTYQKMSEAQKANLFSKGESAGVGSPMNLKFRGTANKEYQIGGFAQPKLEDWEKYHQVNLKDPNNGSESDNSSLEFSIVTGSVSDIMAHPQYQNAVFQAASQFNGLEMNHPTYTPEHGIAIYTQDYSQGPRVAIAGTAGTLYRNYFLNKEYGKGVDGLNGCFGKTQFGETQLPKKAANEKYTVNPFGLGQLSIDETIVETEKDFMLLQQRNSHKGQLNMLSDVNLYLRDKLRDFAVSTDIVLDPNWKEKIAESQHVEKEGINIITMQNGYGGIWTNSFKVFTTLLTTGDEVETVKSLKDDVGVFESVMAMFKDDNHRKALKNLIRVPIMRDTQILGVYRQTEKFDKFNEDVDQVLQTQVFSSAWPLSTYAASPMVIKSPCRTREWKDDDGKFWCMDEEATKQMHQPIASLILEATYEHVFHAATAHRNYHAEHYPDEEKKNIVVLTLPGDGEFRNDRDWILDALKNAVKKFENEDLDVRLNLYNGDTSDWYYNKTLQNGSTGIKAKRWKAQESKQ